MPVPRLVKRLIVTAKTLAQFGAGPIALNGLYRFGLLTGHYRRLTPPFEIPLPNAFTPPSGTPEIQDVLRAPAPDALRQVLGDRDQALLQEADEIVAGSVRLFGGPPVPLVLEPPTGLRPLAHWTAYEGSHQHWIAGQDIKFIWEPGRFGWVFPLARAYCLSADERYPRAFWQYAARFVQANPPNLGPQWTSGQEVALRLIALAFGAQVFRPAEATTSARLAWLAAVLRAHARRIPLTLVYARSQRNNHQVTEAAGLITAAAALPDDPDAGHWRELGLHWFNQAILSQVSPDGEYIQHSTNYHRLMLQAALWVFTILAGQGQPLPEEVTRRLGLAAGWLADRLDPVSGRAPNLGHNDGAFILPLASGGYADYRPVVQAACQAFCGQDQLAPGPWDENALWLVNPARQTPGKHLYPGTHPTPATILRAEHSWAELRAVTYHDRPAHADQLHVDLWWQGINVAQDAGTYLYNAPPPWENALVATRAHNTVEVDGLDQMTRAGRFRWVDWAQAQVLGAQEDASTGCRSVTASHYGYAQLGAIHRRTLESLPGDDWRVIDEILLAGHNPQARHLLRLHWLLPDAPWHWERDALSLTLPIGSLTLRIKADTGTGPAPLNCSVSLIRAGETLLGDAAPDPILGWVSPTYGQRLPALSLSIRTQSQLPVRFCSEWQFKQN